MISVLLCPAFSSAVRMAPTRPSIMSDGPTMSAPASAWLTACFTSTSEVVSLSTYPCSSMMPSCPCVVNGSSATSVMMPRSGWVDFRARAARWASPSGL